MKKRIEIKTCSREGARPFRFSKGSVFFSFFFRPIRASQSSSRLWRDPTCPLAQFSKCAGPSTFHRSFARVLLFPYLF